ncbi:NRDE family protein [Sediminibacterium goheungense]|uniref:Transport and Golgi organization protein 2 n=1 Tax=Sediminibacterium goheungense TaxID=1086393 RepID=A0A4R6J1A2_9BACT|nr:NRDE family protein [Sediminibacterium goheungense]TDO29020.1 transport and Golgi organization protein 2 [Sediminibacterium goheungense]
MCTVTFLPLGDKVLLTSNRDEKVIRKRAILPSIARYGETQILFPKDAQAGGTWIGVSEKGTAMVLLNGGFIKHEPAAAYRRSRGLIFLDILSQTSAFAAFKKINLIGIEPFTLIIWENASLHECRWSGEEKYIREMDTTQPHIWSSVTLYAPDIIQKREHWFRNWLIRYPQPSVTDIRNFHLFGGEGDCENDICMNRDNTMATVSVTSIECESSQAIMLYEDLINQEQNEERLAFVQQYPVA